MYNIGIGKTALVAVETGVIAIAWQPISLRDTQLEFASRK